MISRIESEFGRFPYVVLVVLVFAAATGCISRAPARPLVLSVTNELGRSIAEIREKPCGDLELSFVPIEDSRLEPGETRGVVVPATCVDLVAFDSRGRVVGEQRGLLMLSRARWVLRR